MSSEREQAFLNDILEAAQRITTYIDQMSYKEFLDDLKRQDAVMRNSVTTIIGYANNPITEANWDGPWRRNRKWHWL